MSPGMKSRYMHPKFNSVAVSNVTLWNVQEMEISRGVPNFLQFFELPRPSSHMAALLISRRFNGLNINRLKQVWCRPSEGEVPLCSEYVNFSQPLPSCSARLQSTLCRSRFPEPGIQGKAAQLGAARNVSVQRAFADPALRANGGSEGAIIQDDPGRRFRRAGRQDRRQAL